MLEYRYLGGLPAGAKGDPVTLSLAGNVLQFICPGIFGVGGWSYGVPLQAIEDVRIGVNKVLVVETKAADVASTIRLTGAWVDLEVAYSTISRACPWLGPSDDAQAARPAKRSRLIQTLDAIQLFLFGVLMLLVSVFAATRWPLR
jgi:hypothetical protein